MADYERKILEYYQLTSPNPSEWPAEKDNSDASEDEEDAKIARKAMSRKSKSRYSALERAASDRKSYLPGFQIADNGVENLVQRDEADPLGSTDSVVQKLKALGLSVQEDTRLRNRFLLSSTTFSPSLFLSQVHSTASTQDLVNGLEVLSRSIDQKSASLKVLVESNFERFVRAKATIDNVYKEMKYKGVDPVISRQRAHSRHASRNSFRMSSDNHASIADETPDSKKKNALTKESDFGVLGIKSHLLDVSAKAEEVWGPALGGREKEDILKVMIGTIEQYKGLYEVNTTVTESIKRKDYETIVEEYGKARRFAAEGKKLSESLGSATPTDSEIFRILLAARVWNDVEEQIEEFKRDVWRRLIATQSISPKSDANRGILQEQHMELIAVLLDLGVTDNPIWVWLLSRYDHLKNKIQITSDRSKIEIEILRRRLANGEKPTTQVIASHLRSLGRYTGEDKPSAIDSSDTIDLWEKMHTFLTSMLSNQGILGEVVEFWQTVQSFIDGNAQRTLPTGLEGESLQHHKLSDEGITELRKATVELVDMIRESVSEFFIDPPIDDISALFSPLPPTTPRTPVISVQPSSTGLRDPRTSYDLNNLPPPSPRRGEAWEKFAFWPPWSNSLSGVHYLGKLLVLVGSGASEMAALSPVREGDSAAYERLKALVGGARERCATAVCAAWNRDAENIKVLEDWRTAPEKRDLTRMPTYYGAFEGAVLSGMQRILYISEAMTKSDSTNVVTPPPPKLLQMVRSQFVTTLYKSLAGLVENAESAAWKTQDDWTPDPDGLASPVAMVLATSIGANSVNANDRNVRMLLTLSNLQSLRVEVVPNLTTQFENAFSVKLTEESKTIRDVLGQIDARLFSSFTRPSVDSLRAIIRTGITSPTWSPTEKPREVRPYVYEALLLLVLVHTQVSTTASILTAQVLSYLLEHISKELLDAFKLRQRWTLPDLMQATLDVEFVAQTLNQYATDKASETQSQIYQELDRGTDNEARAKLQIELPEMRAVLKRLREGSRSEFACFKKSRARPEKPSSISGQSTTLQDSDPT